MASYHPENQEPARKQKRMRGIERQSQQLCTTENCTEKWEHGLKWKASTSVAQADSVVNLCFRKNKRKGENANETESQGGLFMWWIMLYWVWRRARVSWRNILGLAVGVDKEHCSLKELNSVESRIFIFLQFAIIFRNNIFLVFHHWSSFYVNYYCVKQARSKNNTK